MASSRFQIDWAMIQLLVITVLAFAIGLAGCGPLADTVASSGASSVPADLVPFQGKWKFDEDRSGDSSAPAEPATEEEQALLNAMKAIGVVMSDIDIRGTQITQLGGILQAQYDLLDYRSEGGRIIGTALWHEDRHDPGDCTEIKVTLQRDGNTLIFTREDDGDSQRFYFTR